MDGQPQEQKTGASDTLLWSFDFHYHRDRMNAAVHCSPTRFSPLTVRLYFELIETWPEDEEITMEMAIMRRAIENTPTESKESE